VTDYGTFRMSEGGVMAGDNIVQLGESEDSPFELAVAWAKTTAPGPVRRNSLPAAVQSAIGSAIEDRLNRKTVVLAARTLIDGVETSRTGPVADLPPDDELLVVSVVTSDVSTTAIHVVAHTVVVHLVAN
jgi:hypothetical protein